VSLYPHSNDFSFYEKSPDKGEGIPKGIGLKKTFSGKFYVNREEVCRGHLFNPSPSFVFGSGML
jgi:hypothetical protein